MSCAFAHDDGSYVLGSLSPTERQAFEEHLVGCADCARSVRELAGLPGLLARVDADVLLAAGDPEPVPETLLPALVHDVRRTQRRRVLLASGVAAAAAVVVGLGSLAATGAFGHDGTTGPSASAPTPAPSSAVVPVGQTMLPVGHEPVSGNLALTSVLWGTKLDLTCRYKRAAEYPTSVGETYAMFVRTKDGRVQEVATWRGLPGRTMRLAAATAASRQDITWVEVRTTGGTPVLRLTS